MSSYLKRCLHHGPLGESMLFQSSAESCARVFTRFCKFISKLRTQFVATTSSCSMLYTAARPRAERLSASGQLVHESVSSCLSCVLLACLVDDKNGFEQFE